MKCLLGALSALLVAGHTNFAEAQVAVYVKHSGYDAVGKELDFAFREAIRQSATFKDTYESDDASMRANLVTLNPDDDSRSQAQQTRTIYAITVTMNINDQYDHYLTSSVGKCGASVVRTCASDLLQVLGVQLEEIRSAIRQIQKEQEATP